MKFWFYLFFSLWLFLAGFSISLAAMTSGSGYEIWADAISDGGSENAASDSYFIDDTLGEAGIGRSSSTNYSARIGFREMTRERSLTFSVSPSSLSLGQLSASQTKSGSHSITVGTNSSSGVSVTFSGSTLTCGSCGGVNTITAIGSSATASQSGTSQFGFNVIYSSGSAPSASAVSPYNVSGSYAFNSGDQIISANEAINDTIFNVNYIANINSSESAGSYSSSIIYTAVANF